MRISSVTCDGPLFLVDCAYASVCLFHHLLFQELLYRNKQEFQDAQLFIAGYMVI